MSVCTQEMHAELVVGQASATARSHPCTCIGACLRAFVHTHMHVRQRVFAQNRTNISSCRTVPLAHRTRKRGLCSSAQGRQGEQPNEARAAGAQLLVIERRQACVDLSLKESVGQGNQAPVGWKNMLMCVSACACACACASVPSVLLLSSACLPCPASSSMWHIEYKKSCWTRKSDQILHRAPKQMGHTQRGEGTGGGSQSWEGEGREEESREIARTSRDNAERLALKDGTGSAMASLSRRIMRMHRTSTQNIDLHIAVAFVGPSHVT